MSFGFGFAPHITPRALSELMRQARVDAVDYADLLIGDGGTDIRDNGEFGNILEWNSELYGEVNQRVEYFTLRSTQNMGTGSTAYGSLGTAATLVNGPTWGADGVRRSPGSNKYITIPNTDIAAAGQFTLFAVAKLDIAASGKLLSLISQSGAADPFNSSANLSLYTDASSNNELIRCAGMSGGDGARNREKTNANGAFVGNGFHSWIASMGEAPDFDRVIIRDGVSGGSDSGSGTSIVNAGSNAYLIRENSADTSYDVTIAFSLSYTVTLNAPTMLAIASLYKSTIGQGLGLP